MQKRHPGLDQAAASGYLTFSNFFNVNSAVFN